MQQSRQASRIIGEIEDKVIVFTEYRATNSTYVLCLRQPICHPALDGSLSSSRKEVRELFRKAHVLVSTESGGEGLNFQLPAMSSITTFLESDAPEQRIGRTSPRSDTTCNITQLSTERRGVSCSCCTRRSTCSTRDRRADIILAQLGQEAV